MKNVKQYYKELGKLVYAIAISDGCIQSEEVHKLHEFVKKDLAHLESHSDSSGMNEAFYVNFEFDESADKKIDTIGIVNTFCDYVTKNAEPGDEKLIEHTLNLLNNVANAYVRDKEQNIIENVKNKLSGITLVKSHS